MKLVNGILMGAVVVILVGALLVPVIDSSEPGAKTLDVLIIDGQSNAEYGAAPVCDPDVLNAEYDVAPAHSIYYYGTTTAPANQWDWSHQYNYAWTAFHVRNAYDYDAGEWIIGGYEPILGNTISQKSGNDVLVVNMAIGARTIEQLLPDGEDGEYSWGVLDRALAEMDGYKIRMVGVVWIQGESDNATPVSDYKASFVELMDAFEEYGADQFYLVHTRDYYGGNANQAQDELAAEYSNVTMTTEITETFTVDNGMLDPNNPIHYSQSGRDAISFAIKDKIAIPTNGSADYRVLLMAIPAIVIVALALSMIRRAE